MAFPSVAGTPAGSQNANDAASSTATMPAGITVGEGLLVFAAIDGNPTITIDTGVSGTNWQELAAAGNGTIVQGRLFYKVAEGSDALKINLSVNEKASFLVYRISAGGTPTVTSNNGTSTDTNPPLHTPPGGAQDYLWFVARLGDAAVVATVAPSGYSNLVSEPGASASAASVSVAERQLNAASDDPGTFTSANEQWIGLTVAVPPAAASDTGIGSSSGIATVSGEGKMDVTGIGSADGVATVSGVSVNSSLTVLTIAEPQLPVYDCDPWGSGQAAVTISGTHDAPGRVAQYRIHDAAGTLLVDWTDFTLPAGSTWSLVLNRPRSFAGNRVTVRGKVETAVTAQQSAAWYAGYIVAVLGQSLAARPFHEPATATLTPTANRLWVLSNNLNGTLAAGFLVAGASSILGRRRAAQMIEAYGDAPVALVDLTQVGTGRSETSDAEEVTNRSWAATMQDPVDYVRTRGSDVSIVLDHWFTSDAGSWSDFIRHWAPFYLRQQIDGLADNPDASGVQNYAGGAVSCVPSRTYTPVHFLFDLTGGGQGLFSTARTKWVPAFGASHTGTGGRSNGTWYTADEQKGAVRAALEQMAEAEAAYQPITLRSVAGWTGQASFGGHLARPAGTHVSSEIDGESLVAVSLTAAILRTVNRLPRSEPRILSVSVSPSGSYADVTVSLPHGGDLSTAFVQHAAGAYAGSFEAANWVTPAVLPETSIAALHNVQGFAIRQGGSWTFTGFTAEIINTGAGAVPSRTGVIRITPTVPFVTTDAILFGYADGHMLLTGTDVDNGLVHLHWPIETRTHVSGTGYGWPVIKESGDLPLFVLTVTGAAIGSAAGVATVSGQGKTDVTGIAAVVAGATAAGQGKTDVTALGVAIGQAGVLGVGLSGQPLAVRWERPGTSPTSGIISRG